MWDFSFGKAIRLIMQTLPFILLRCVVYFGMVLAYILMIGVGAGVGYGLGGFGSSSFQGSATLIGGLVGLGVTGGVLYFLREYILYTVKAGHIAVLVLLLDNKEIPNGKSQISYATQTVKEQFSQTNMLFALDLLIKGVVKAITGLVQGISSFLPLPGVEQIMGVVRAFLRVAIGLLDEMILAYILRSKQDNPWLSARSALILYGQNAGPMLKNAAWVTLFTYGLSFLIFLLMLAPAAALAYLMPGAWSAAGVLFALLFSWAIKAAILEPLAIICLLQAYTHVIAGQTPNPEWESRLDQASTAFSELKDKALTWTKGRPDSDATPTAEQK